MYSTRDRSTSSLKGFVLFRRCDSGKFVVEVLAECGFDISVIICDFDKGFNIFR